VAFASNRSVRSSPTLAAANGLDAADDLAPENLLYSFGSLRLSEGHDREVVQGRKASA